jgi:hypothetical protein
LLSVHFSGKNELTTMIPVASYLDKKRDEAWSQIVDELLPGRMASFITISRLPSRQATGLISVYRNSSHSVDFGGAYGLISSIFW